MTRNRKSVFLRASITRGGGGPDISNIQNTKGFDLPPISCTRDADMAGMAGVGTLRLAYAPSVGEVTAGENAQGVDNFDDEKDELGHRFSNFGSVSSAAGFVAFFLKGRGVNNSADDVELLLSLSSSSTSISSCKNVFSFGFVFCVALKRSSLQGRD